MRSFPPAAREVHDVLRSVASDDKPTSSPCSQIGMEQSPIVTHNGSASSRILHYQRGPPLHAKYAMTSADEAALIADFEADQES